ncbi:hypothetical protein [Lacisediminihabitans profunda]|uniref:Cupin domain-containing protein n=1 Tax=Lacisediminihabitans profunda TaxID=2594790 RepID=A0A5C8UKI0_9MICO|nr:hypothetical protein [Lacisediminihabitans profunda]TXN28755.1 hypothetical protein FVP33_16300 [Lacisediminihabitans profunda]
MVVLLPGEGPRATLVWRGDEREAEATIELQPNTFTVVPPGTATLSVSAAGPIVRVFSAGNTDLLSGCLNASYYTIDDPNIPPFRPWSDAAPNSTPVSFDFGTVEPAPGRFGRIYRSDSAMVNVFYPQHGPRDPSALSPHVHDSFDQISLQIHGEFVHHVRTSWGPDSGNWRPDEHRLCTGPSIVIFPPPLIHTSQATGLALNQLVDIFGPPRADFAGQPGWLLNAHGDTDE